MKDILELLRVKNKTTKFIEPNFALCFVFVKSYTWPDKYNIIFIINQIFFYQGNVYYVMLNKYFFNVYLKSLDRFFYYYSW